MTKLSRRIVYSPRYYVDIGEHVFPVIKYKLVRDRLIKSGKFSQEDFQEPAPAKDEDILLVHTDEYVKKLKEGKLSPMEELTMEVPYSKELVEVSWICAGGTIQACKNALEDRVGVHLGGGFHHAFPDHGEGFCVINDVAIGVRRLLEDKLIERACVIDCDLHQGNGTSFIFAEDKRVFTFSIHQENLYPAIKPPSSLDIGLEDGTDDQRYMDILGENIPRIMDDFKPDFILYVAGADPYKNDQLGALCLTKKGLKERDELVFSQARQRDVPAAVVLAGGYALDVNDTAEIHCNTIETAWKNQ